MRLSTNPYSPSTLYIPARTPVSILLPNYGIGDLDEGTQALINSSVQIDPNQVGGGGGTPSFGSNAAGGAAAGFSIGVSAALQSGSNIAGGIAGALAFAAPFAGPAAPILLAFASLIGPVASMFKGCGNTCKEATAIADKAGAALKQVSDTYWAASPRYKASQTAALYTIQQVAGYINQACGNPALGPAGQRCISERTVRGGSAPWCPTGTGCDLWTTYYDPIANDTGVTPDPPPASTSTSTSGFTTTNPDGSPSITPILLIGAGVLAALYALGGD